MTGYDELRERLRARPRNWLVTGAAGFIGSNLVEALLELDQHVVGLDNFSLGTRSNLAQVRAAVTAKRWERFCFIEGDIRSPDACRLACRSVHVVLHQAALGSVPRSLADPVATHESNVSGFVNMLAAAHAAHVTRFVYAGSSAVYGDHPARPRVEGAIGRPLSPYALSKRVNEQYAEVFARCYGLESIGLRYFNVFGPRQDPNGAYAAVIAAWIAGMIRNEPVYINGDGGTTRDFCYVDNVVQANLLAATVADPTALDQVYNIAVGESTSLTELFGMLRALLEARYPHVRGLGPRHREFRPGDVPFSLGDIDKAQRLLGYRPAWRLRQGLERTIEWYATRVGDNARAPGLQAA